MIQEADLIVDVLVPHTTYGQDFQQADHHGFQQTEGQGLHQADGWFICANDNVLHQTP